VTAAPLCGIDQRIGRQRQARRVAADQGAADRGIRQRQHRRARQQLDLQVGRLAGGHAHRPELLGVPRQLHVQQQVAVGRERDQGGAVAAGGDGGGRAADHLHRGAGLGEAEHVQHLDPDRGAGRRRRGRRRGCGGGATGAAAAAARGEQADEDRQQDEKQVLQAAVHERTSDEWR
jgi:hypothetical protein